MSILARWIILKGDPTSDQSRDALLICPEKRAIPLIANSGQTATGKKPVINFTVHAGDVLVWGCNQS